MNHGLVEQCVEKLCRKGCKAVWSDIDRLESGHFVPEVKGLSDPEVEAVVRELKSVMAVYEGRCVTEAVLCEPPVAHVQTRRLTPT